MLTWREDVKATDVQAVREIVESSGFFSKEEVDVAVELVEERINKGSRSGYYFVFVEEDGQIVGYTCFGPIACTTASFDLYWIAVHNDCRCRGLGRLLLEKTEPIIARLGGRRIYIETSSRAQYEPTRGFYLKCGYRQETILEDFYAPGDGKVIYVKALPAGE